MIGRPKKQPPLHRSPHLERQQQTTFRYSSNRSQASRTLSRQENPTETDKAAASKWASLQRFKRAPYILGAVAVIILVVYLSLLPAPPKVVISGNQTPLRTGAPYTQVVTDLTSNLWSRSKFTINRQKITTELQTKFPELQQVTVNTPLFARHAVVELKITQPALVLNSGSDTFLLDNRGVALLNMAHETALFKTETLPVVTDQSNTRIETGKQALTSAQVAFIQEVSRQSQAKQLTTESITLSAGAGELAVRYTGLSYFVKYNLNEDARKSFGTFFATKEYIESTHTKPAEYIDVRIPERAYVK